MLEIIALIFLTKNIGNLALDKGLKPGTWKLYTVLAWFASEIVGIALGIVIFGSENIFPAILVGIAAAITSYFIIKSTLEKKPNVMDDDIDQLGQQQ